MKDSNNDRYIFYHKKKGVLVMKKQLLTLVFIVLMAVLLVACGGGDDAEDSNTNNDNGADETTTESADGEVVDIKASNWEFDQETYTVAAGEVTVKLTNEEGFHGIEIVDTDVSLQSEGSTTATLEPGEYTIRCNIPCGAGHDDMVATLIVE